MKILFVVSRLDSTNGICAQAVVKHLAKHGMEVYILTQSSKSTAELDKLENIHISMVSSNPVTNVVQKLGAKKNRLGAVVSAVQNFIHRVWVLLCYPCWPLTSPYMARKFSKQAINLVKKESIDVVVPIYSSLEMLIAGHKVKEQVPEVKLVPYFLDALSAGQTPRFMSQQTKQKKALRWEKKLLSNADGIVMMAAAKKSYEEIDQNLEYLDRTVFLDIPMLNCRESVKSTQSRKYFPENEKVFFFAGAMARNIRDPQKLIELFSSVEVPDWRLYLAGSSDYMRIIDEAVKNDPRIRFLGRLPHSQVEEMMEEADFLVNIGNTLSYMVPSKIFEYMAFEKPIVSTCKLKDDPSLPYLELYKKTVILDEQLDVDVSAAQLERFVADVDTGKLQWTSLSDLTEIDAPLYNNTPAAFGRYLEMILQ